MVTISRNQLTDVQYGALKKLKVGEVVKGMKLLTKLEKLGVVKLRQETGCIVSTGWCGCVKAWYIDDSEYFEVEGVGKFWHKYVDGCFCPYLVKETEVEL